MKYGILRKVILLAAVTAGCLAFDAKAGETPKIKVGDQEFTQEQIITDFLNIAVNRHVWMSDTNMSDIIIKPIDQDTANAIESSYQWMKPYVYREEGLPAFSAINKWKKDIVITTGWSISSTGRHHTTVDEQFAGIVKSQVENLIPQLTEITGLNIQYVDHMAGVVRNEKIRPSENPQAVQDYRAGQKNQKRVNIRFISQSSLGSHKNLFKSTRFVINGSYPMWMEGYIYGAVQLTPQARAQADGYYIPASDNTIDYAVCRVWAGHTKEMMRSLITECLLRVLGLPNPSKLTNDSVLGLWNTPFEPISKTVLHDGTDAFDVTTNRSSLIINTEEEEKELREFNYDDLVYESAQRSAQVQHRHSLTPFDEYMLRLLYNRDLKAGMNVYAAAKKLAITTNQEKQSIGSE